MAEALEDPFVREAAALPKKKSLFSKSTWAKPVAQKEGIEFFSRADELWPSRLAEEERKRQKKATKLERKISSASAERKPSSTPDSKRRRVSQNKHERHSSEGSLNHDDPDEASWARSRKSNSNSSRPKSQTSPVSLSERYSRELHAKEKEVSKSEIAGKGYISLSESDEAGHAAQEISGGAPKPINLDDDDDDDDVLAVSSKPAARIEEDPNLSDEEFPELARQAREREKQKERARLMAGKSFENKNHDTNGSNTPVHVIDDIFEERPVILEDPVVEIFVSSWIEGTKPLVVRRKLSQKLKEVRLIWCDKQSISGQPLQNSIKESIFLTWRGKKLYDLTNCKSLGLKIDGNGHLYSDGEGFREDKVHFEAWTQDIYDRYQLKLAAKQDRGYSEDEVEMVEQVVEAKIRLIMKAKGMEPFKLYAKRTTTVSKMAAAFRESRNIPEGKEIALYFDGDRLDPDSKVEDAELDEMDNIEVHIR